MAAAAKRGDGMLHLHSEATKVLPLCIAKESVYHFKQH